MYARYENSLDNIVRRHKELCRGSIALQVVQKFNAMVPATYYEYRMNMEKVDYIKSVVRSAIGDIGWNNFEGSQRHGHTETFKFSDDSELHLDTTTGRLTIY